VWQGGIYGGGKIPAIVMTAKGKRGFTSQEPYNHYSLLSTLEWNWNLPLIGNASDTVQVHPMTEFFTK
jgi:phosphatidylinositol-3-phosphatase